MPSPLHQCLLTTPNVSFFHCAGLYARGRSFVLRLEEGSSSSLCSEVVGTDEDAGLQHPSPMNTTGLPLSFRLPGTPTSFGGSPGAPLNALVEIAAGAPTTGVLCVLPFCGLAGTTGLPLSSCLPGTPTSFGGSPGAPLNALVEIAAVVAPTTGVLCVLPFCGLLAGKRTSPPFFLSTCSITPSRFAGVSKGGSVDVESGNKETDKI